MFDLFIFKRANLQEQTHYNLINSFTGRDEAVQGLAPFGLKDTVRKGLWNEYDLHILSLDIYQYALFELYVLTE